MTKLVDKYYFPDTLCNSSKFFLECCRTVNLHLRGLQQITSTVSSGLASASAFPGVQAGSVVITDRAVDARFQPRFEQVVLGDVVVRGTDLDGGLVEELLACSEAIPDFPTLVGHTMCTYDFYEGKTCFGCPFPRGALT